jgi:hypothetical protein
MGIRRKRLSVNIYLWGREASIFIRDTSPGAPPPGEVFIAQLQGVTPESPPSDVLVAAARAFRERGR